METIVSTKDIVFEFIDALNNNEFDIARQHLADDVKFTGVLGKRDDADNYIADMEKMKFKYAIKKAFAEGDDVCLWYDINMSGLQVPTCGLYNLKDDKIRSINVLFDPRPVLEKSDKK